MINATLKIDGLEELVQNFDKAPEEIFNEVHDALANSIAMAETESKRRTPVATGNLQSSIGANVGDENTKSGFIFVKGLSAGVGTNVAYSVAVHEGHQKHNNGERKFMEKGLEVSMNYIQGRFQKAFDNIAQFLAKG